MTERTRWPVLLFAVVVVVCLVALGISAATRGNAHATVAACGGRLASFPGAEGYGCATPGGRGGRVMIVSNLADSGPGSLRKALESPGRRYVVFAVAGTIDVSDQIIVDDPYVTVAGQTAPGGGITLRAGPGNESGLVDVRTHDVVIRFLRFRAGDPGGVSGENLDGLNIWEEGGYNVLVDHNSFSWAVDENVSTWDDARNITFSWNIIAEGLRYATHPEGEHSKGLLVSGARTKNMSVLHNLFADNTARNPQISAPGNVQVVNNVIFNWGDSALQTSNAHGSPHVDIVGNYFRAGPDSDPDRYEIDAYPEGPAGTWSIHLEGNTGPHSHFIGTQRDLVTPEDRGIVVDHAPPGLPTVTVTHATQAYEDVLAHAGARVPSLDRVDAQVIDDVRQGRGRMVDDAAEAGGWPALAAGKPRPDHDRDGLPDAWEARNGLIPGHDDSRGDPDGDGYTNIEEYANALAASAYPH